MANNTTLNAGTGGDVIADEDVAGVKYQLIKLVDSTATSTTRTGVAANPLQVSLANTATNSTAIKVDNSAVTQPVSGTVTANLGTIAGVSTAAKQPALGTAGSASADVLSVQGIASMTALKVDGSAVTQPVSGTFWQATQPVSGTVIANAGTNLNTSALALETGGNLATVAGAVSSAKMQVQQNAAIIPASTILQNAAVANGNGTSLTVTGYATATLNIVSSPAMSGGTTVNFEASVDNTTWVAISGRLMGTATIAATATSDGDYRFDVAGYTSLRTRISNYSAGTTTIKGYVSPLAGMPSSVNANVQGTVPVSAASLPLPTGAATSAKQPTLGTAGSASADVLSVQGIASMTSLKVDGSGVTQPVSLTSTTVTGTVAVTESGTWTVQPGNTANTTPWLVSSQAATSGGATPYKLNSAASTNATSVKNTAGMVYSIEVFNTNAAIRYLKLYDKSSAPTVGTDTPIKVIAVPGASAGSGVVINNPVGVVFSSGIAFATTTGAADADTAAVAANDLIINLNYK